MLSKQSWLLLFRVKCNTSQVWVLFKSSLISVSLLVKYGGNILFLSEMCFFLWRSTLKTRCLLLPSSDDETNFSSKLNASFAIQQFKGSSQWEILELYIVCTHFKILPFFLYYFQFSSLVLFLSRVFFELFLLCFNIWLKFLYIIY